MMREPSLSYPNSMPRAQGWYFWLTASIFLREALRYFVGAWPSVIMMRASVSESQATPNAPRHAEGRWAWNVTNY